MNEEEIRKNILREIVGKKDLRLKTKFLSVEMRRVFPDIEKAISMGIKEGFQKGKLEQKKEDNNILIKYSKLRLYRSKSCQLLIKQLQKEIGGNEK